MLFQPLRQFQRVGRMPLRSQAQRFQPEQELLSRERVHRRAQIPQNLHPHANGKRDGAECVPEFETMVSFGRIVELGKSLGVLAPVEFPAVDDHTSNGGAVSADPFGGRVHDDIGTVVERSAEITASAKGVIDLPPFSA